MKKTGMLMKALAAGMLFSFLTAGPVFAADARSLLNSVQLTPVKTGRVSADRVVEEILSQITTPEMDTYSKVKACYDYLINNTEYAPAGDDAPADAQDADFIEYGADSAYATLTRHIGVCDDYSDAFAAMVRAIGLNCYNIIGSTHKASGEMTPHDWNVIKINGTEYVFDAEIEDVIAKGGAIGYHRFCVTYGEVPGKYEPSQIKLSFVPFDQPEMKAQVEQDGYYRMKYRPESVFSDMDPGADSHGVVIRSWGDSGGNTSVHIEVNGESVDPEEFGEYEDLDELMEALMRGM